MKSINLLEDRVIPLLSRSGDVSLHNLPETLQLLSEGDVLEIADTKEFQSSAVEFFFAQLGVLCIDIGDDDEGMSPGIDVWRERILKLAPEAAWFLFNSDPTIPAFLQPGMAQEELEIAQEKGDVALYPDDMGALVKSKNHGVKFSSMANPSIWNWIVSLIEIQTMTGIDGAGNYGHQRMNGGYSYRFKAGVYNDLTASGRWISDVKKVLDNLDKTYENNPHFDPYGGRKALAWDAFWDGETPLHSKDMHPLYIDTNRRMRMFFTHEGILSCARRTSKGTRVFNLELKGAYGDPWAPLYKKKGSDKDGDVAGYRALFMPDMNLETLCDVMFGQSGFQMALTQYPSSGQKKQDCYFEIKFLGKSQGKTAGYFSRAIPIPTRVVSGLGNSEQRQALGSSSSELLKMARAAQRALSIGIDTLSVNGSGKSADKSLSANGVKPKAIASFTKEIESSFFAHLWTYHDSQDDTSWISFLHNLCLQEFEAAAQCSKTRTQLSFKAEALGRNAFENYWHTVFSKKKEGAAA